MHRFAPTVGDRAPGLPVARAARRLPGVLAVRESWRVTPAGSAPGPVPHRVVLVETAGPDDCDHVVHHLAHAARSLDDTSVEVFASGATLPVYHREALAAARPLFADEPAAGSVAARQPAPQAPERQCCRGSVRWTTTRPGGRSPTRAPPGPARSPRSRLLRPTTTPRSPDSRTSTSRPTSRSTRGRTPSRRWRPLPPRGPPWTSRSSPTRRTPRPRSTTTCSSTARRIAALWARPAPEDFSAPLAEGSLEPTRLEPADDGPASREVAAPEVEEQPEADDEPPSGRHGRFAATDLGTTSFRSPRSRTNGHRVERVEDEAADTGDLEISAPAPATGAAIPEDDQSDDDAQVQRARHSRARDGDSPLEGDPGPARFGHDARYGAGAGPAWPGGPVSENSGPGPDTLFASPVDVGGEPVAFGANGHRHAPELVGADDEPVTLGTNGHRHEPVAAGPDDEPATGPVAWSGRRARRSTAGLRQGNSRPVRRACPVRRRTGRRCPVRRRPEPPARRGTAPSRTAPSRGGPPTPARTSHRPGPPPTARAGPRRPPGGPPEGTPRRPPAGAGEHRVLVAGSRRLGRPALRPGARAARAPARGARAARARRGRRPVRGPAPAPVRPRGPAPAAAGAAAWKPRPPSSPPRTAARSPPGGRVNGHGLPGSPDDTGA